ncbi:MAG: proteasome-type protease [Roseibium album]|uniref:Proteasome endopeptidase complex, archaeal, beta subunit n=1 Tax=Roseibium album TaxID=311410 RepID=A0A0M6Z9Q8_9HYPH|nr:proteasome-type protease [Roseibium album]MBG6148137.1 putative proteasome-type protease [Labrenzia sp. EL_142]MBG6166796.1 putative proteasome-type protease [Labrenzia sp. EL_195]MBG6172916.1 putative proteasome-type protease [Labrenzia sp. EL_132]MBG6202718.1 putative proteasome-type protease [Labrenzia sp. EL_13]MBG6226865.1 putative proteasome-type protease [Labrenzia sp. EL_208]
MTYCVGLKLDRGLVFAADTRTNAGVDNIATYKKLHVWEEPGERVITLLSAGNLAITQAVVSLLSEHITSADNDRATLLTAKTMFQVARLVGSAVREVKEIDGEALATSAESFFVTFILGGQIEGEEPRMFQIYAAGNFIEVAEDTPFLQIGEHKYGKPILDRVTRSDMRLGEAAKLVLLSFDSTLRSNLSVGTPIDMLLYNKDTFSTERQVRIEQDDPYFQKLSHGWSEKLRDAFGELDEFDV